MVVVVLSTSSKTPEHSSRPMTPEPMSISHEIIPDPAPRKSSRPDALSRVPGQVAVLLAPLRTVPDDVVRRAADRDDVGRAVAVEVAAAEVLRGDVAVDDGSVPGLAVRSKSYIETRWSLPRWPAKISSSPSPSTSATQRAWPSARVSSMTVRGLNCNALTSSLPRARESPAARQTTTWLPCHGSIVARNAAVGQLRPDGPRSRRASGLGPGAAQECRAKNRARLALEEGLTPPLSAVRMSETAVAIRVDHLDGVHDLTPGHDRCCARRWSQGSRFG